MENVRSEFENLLALRVTGYELWITSCGLRVAGCGLRVAGCGLRVAGCGLRVKKRRMKKINYLKY